MRLGRVHVVGSTRLTTYVLDTMVMLYGVSWRHPDAAKQ